MTCPYCGAPVSVGDNFCARCRYALTNSPVASLAPVPAPYAPQVLNGGPPSRSLLDAANKFLRFLAPKDSAFVKLALERVDEQDKWNDVFSTKLIELLDNIDTVKSELRKRMRAIESAVRAEEYLAEQGTKAAAVTERASAVVSAAERLRPELEAAVNSYREAVRLHVEGRELLKSAEHCYQQCESTLANAIGSYQKTSDLAAADRYALRQSIEKMGDAAASYLHASEQLKEAADSATHARRAMQDARADYARASADCAKASRLSTLTVRTAVLLVGLGWAASGMATWLTTRARPSLWATALDLLLMIVFAVIVWKPRGRTGEA